MERDTDRPGPVTLTDPEGGRRVLKNTNNVVRYAPHAPDRRQRRPRGLKSRRRRPTNYFNINRCCLTPLCGMAAQASPACVRWLGPLRPCPSALCVLDVMYLSHAIVLCKYLAVGDEPVPLGA